MLLLVMHAELDQPRRFRFVADAEIKQPRQRVVDVPTIANHFIVSRPSQKSSLRARMTGALALVI